MDYFNPAQAFKEGYAATEAVTSDIQSKDILRQAYADAPNTGSPQGDMSVYAKAAKMAGIQGNASLAHEFNKQAAETGKLVTDQRAAELKDTEGRLGLAAQYLKGATDDASLESAVNAAGLPEQAKMQAFAVLKSNLPFAQKQAKLYAMGHTIAEDIQAERLAIDATNKQSVIDNRKDDNLARDRKEAADILKLKVDTGFFPDTPEGKAALAKEIAAITSKPTTQALATPTTITKPLTTPAPEQSAEDWAKANDIPISPHGGTRSKQEQADQVAQWYAGGMKGIRPAEPGSGAHEGKNAIDVPKEGRTPENRAKLEAAGFKNTVKGEDWHFEREAPKAAPTPSEASKKAAEEVSLPVAGPDGTVATTSSPKAISRKGVGQAGATNSRLAWGIQESALQTIGDLTSIATLPSGADLGALAGLAGKSGTSFTSSLSGITARKLSTDEQRVFQQRVAGFETNIAKALGGGYAQSSTKVIMDNYHQQIAQEGDSPLIMASFLSRAKQELTLLNKAFKAHPGANAGEIKNLDEALAGLNKIITWSNDDIDKALKTTGHPTISEMGSKLTGKTKTSSAAADEAAKAGF